MLFQSSPRTIEEIVSREETIREIRREASETEEMITAKADQR